MRKFLFILGALSLFAFMSCQQPTDSADNNGGGEVSKWGSLEAKALYNEVLGTWEWFDVSSTGAEWSALKYNGFDTVILASDSVTLGTTKYTINQDTDLIKSEDYEGDFFDKETIGIADFYVKLNDRLLGITNFDSWEPPFVRIFWNLYDNSNDNDLKKVSGSGSGSEGDASSINGTYTFNSATGSQSNGTITLSDGNFTYSGGKSNVPSSGTYTVSGSDITFSWTASGYSVSTTVTVSKSGSSVTLSSSEVLFFSTFFGSTAQSGGKYSLTFNYTE